MRPFFFSLLLPVALVLPSAIHAECRLSKYVEIPVTMRGSRPMVSAQIGGKDAQFILDSGAFYSTMSLAAAEAYGLRVDPLPASFRLQGINGATSASETTVRKFELAGVTLPDVPFIVGGTDMGEAGMLGQNFLGIGDVEYDLRHGVVTLLRSQGCKAENLPYWAGSKPFVVIPIEQRSARQTHTIGIVTLNGVKLRAVFDTGAPGAVVTLSAAKRAGVTPASAGVVASGISTGIGTHALGTWMARFDQIQIGGESIPHPKIRISQADLNDADMLIGVDFFMSHHIYVANAAAKMIFTYEGGTVFGVGSAGASDGEGKPLDLADRTAAPTDAEGFSRMGAAHAAERQFDAAIADFDHAIALAPTNAVYLRQRAAARFANHQPLLAAQDLDKALTLDPTDPEARRIRAAMKLAANDPSGAAEDIRALDYELPPSSGERLQLASMAERAGLLELALANVDQWWESHPGDAERPVAQNERCWVRAQLNRELKSALDDCNAALRARPNAASFLDSRALVRLRQGDLAGALADYNSALRLQPNSAWSLYMRGITRRRAGDTVGAEADRRAALVIAPNVGERAAKMGLDN